MDPKVNILRTIRYVALNFATGLTDFDLAVRQPDGTAFTFPTGEGAWTEQGDGVYEVSYTPDSTGLWQELITSPANGDKVVHTIQVVAKDLSDISSEISTTDTDVNAVSVKADSIQSGVDSANTKLDQIEAEVNPGGYIA